MRLSSDLLLRWIRSHPGGEVAPDEAQIEVPPLIIPVVQIPGPLLNFVVPLSTVNQRESFIFSTTRAQGASAAQVTDNVARFGRGLWRIIVTLFHRGDFNGANDAVGASLALESATVGINILRAAPTATVVFSRTLDVTLVFPVDDVLLRLTAGATGVGQAQFVAAEGFGLRLH